MTKNRINFIACLFALVAVGCTGEKEVAESAINIANFNNSKCKLQVSVEPTDNATPASLLDEEYIEYQADDEGYLTINHVNAVFNCAPTKLSATITQADGQITVNEQEETSLADCFCPYDLHYKIGKLTNRKYTLNIYHNNRPLKSFTFEYSKGLRGKLVIREKGTIGEDR